MRLVLLLSVPALFILAQTPARPLLEHTFENGVDGWVGFGVNAQVKTVPAGAGSPGKSALALTYRVEPKQFGAAVFPVSSLAGMKTLRFWLKTDHDAPVAVLLTETKPGGGDYTAIVWSPADTWQEVELTPADFSASDGPNDPKDANGKLDLDSLQGVGVMDLSILFSGAHFPLPIKTDRVSGEHTLWITGFRALGGASPATAAANSTPIDSFERKTVHWIALGGAALRIDPESPVQARALEAKYEQTADGLVVLLRRLAPASLANSSGVTLDVASVKPAHLILTLEEKVPGIAKPVRFNYTLEVPGGKKALHQQIPFKEFGLGDDAPSDAPSSINAAYLRSFSVIDLQPVLSGAGGVNTLWIGGLAGYR